MEKQPSFLQIESLLARKDESSGAASVVESTRQLCLKMLVADSVHDHAVSDNISTLQRRSCRMAQQLAAEIEAAADADALGRCRSLVSDMVVEMQRDVLGVETEAIVSGSEFTTKSTVRAARRTRPRPARSPSRPVLNARAHIATSSDRGTDRSAPSSQTQSAPHPPPPPHTASHRPGAARAPQVGIMLRGTAVEDTVVGGPAFVSGRLARGDVIAAVDGAPATGDSIHRLLVGPDLPGSSVLLTVRKGGPQARTTPSPSAPPPHHPPHPPRGRPRRPGGAGVAVAPRRAAGAAGSAGSRGIQARSGSEGGG